MQSLVSASLHECVQCCFCVIYVSLCANAVCVFLQVDELYEGFCIQRRLRDGASKMKQAFTASPSTKGTRESLVEVNRRYKEYTEVHY